MKNYIISIILLLLCSISINKFKDYNQFIFTDRSIYTDFFTLNEKYHIEYIQIDENFYSLPILNFIFLLIVNRVPVDYGQDGDIFWVRFPDTKNIEGI